jgi:polyphosphate kinase 2 (PPK2 family)
MKIHSKEDRVPEASRIALKEWPTDVEPYHESKKHYWKMLQARIEELSSLQTLLYGSDTYSLLLIFPAMDAAGKDSAIKHVMSGVSASASSNASTSRTKIGSLARPMSRKENYGSTI